MNVLYSILAFTIVLGIIVLIHEFGHFIAARLMGVRVETFSFGFGKRLFGKKVGDTDFRVSLVPLGGYVKMAGEEEWDPDNLKPDEFMAKNRAQKIFILVAGAFMNILLAAAIFTGINMSGVEEEIYKTQPPRIGFIEKGSPAQVSGIQKGDLIRRIDGHSISDWHKLQMIIASSPDSTLSVEYERNGKTFRTSLHVKADPIEHFGVAGIYWDFKTRIFSISKDSPAAQVGLKPGDIIERIDQRPVNYYEITDAISDKAGKPLSLTIRRDGKELDHPLVATPEKVYVLESEAVDVFNTVKQQLKKVDKKVSTALDPYLYLRHGKYIIRSKDFKTESDAQQALNANRFPVPFHLSTRGILGIIMNPYSPTVKKQYGFPAAVKKAGSDMLGLTQMVFYSFRKMIVGKLSAKNLSGPIEIAKFSGRAMETGFSTFVLLIAFISLQLGIVNLFPIPALDGGHLLIYIIESIVRREFSQRVKEILMNIGFVLLITLMAFVILNDIAKILPNGWKSFFPF